jgi:hypothetical protein
MKRNPLQSLAKCRERSGLRVADIINAARQVDTDFPTTHAGYLGIEENGTRDYWKIKALAYVFAADEAEMAAILKPCLRPKKM